MNESTDNIITLLVKITCINNTYIEKKPKSTKYILSAFSTKI